MVTKLLRARIWAAELRRLEPEFQLDIDRFLDATEPCEEIQSIGHAVSDMTVLDTHLLTELMSRKFDCLVQLQELGRQQFQLVDSGEVTQLMRVLSAKQVVIARLQEIEGELNPFRGQKPEERQWASPAARARCAELIDRGQALFREVMLQEKRSETAVDRSPRRSRGSIADRPLRQSGPRGLSVGTKPPPRASRYYQSVMRQVMQGPEFTPIPAQADETDLETVLAAWHLPPCAWSRRTRRCGRKCAG